MKSAIAILSLLAAGAAAQPHKQVHQHQHAAHHKRDGTTVKWVTEFEYTTEVIPVTETIWVSPGFVPPTTTSKTTTSSRATVPAQFFQPKIQSSSSSTTSPSTTAVQSSTTSEAAQAPPSSSSTPTPTPAPSSSPSPTPSPEPAPVVVPSSESVYTPPAQTTAAAPVATSAAASSGGSGSGSSGGPCSKGSPCEGDITYYDVNAGTGACGWNNDGETEDVIALPHELMGTQSNGNPYCGKMVTITLGGKTVNAKVVDKCMGCVGYAIDLSNHAFKDLADMGVGRTQASWYFSE